MNAAEQRAHRTVTQSLEQRIESLETLLLQVSKNCDWLKVQSDEHSAGIEVMHKLSKAGMEAIVKHEYMSFSARLRWLLFGR